MRKMVLVWGVWGVALTLVAFTAVAQSDGPVIKRWSVMEENEEGEEEPVPYMSIDGIMVHESDPAKRAQPRIVAPGAPATRRSSAEAPSDAIVLFDGSDLSKWTSREEGEPTKWVVKDGVMSPTRRSGEIVSKQSFGSCQLHLEFATPKNVKGNGQGRGNSGLFFMGTYEVQILDSYDNTTYPDGQAAALYGRSAPLVNASRGPGEWQSYDVVFHRPIFKDGEVVRQATFTIFHNGVLVQDHYELSGGTGWNGPHAVSEYEPHSDKGPIALQDHGNPVLFRNIWVRELED